MPKRKSKPYKDGELETILSLIPTHDNIMHLSNLLDRSEAAIKIIYRIAYGHGAFGNTAIVQVEKILAAKAKIGIAIGRQTRKKKS